MFMLVPLGAFSDWIIHATAIFALYMYDIRLEKKQNYRTEYWYGKEIIIKYAFKMST